MATVTITQGALKGGKSTTESGFEYYEFLGIPYAKPPVGELRFKTPQPPEPWEGVRDATTTDPSNIACQIDMRTGSMAGSEDCLYLNVYTPKLPPVDSELKPVMVMSHGGGFVTGNGILKNDSGPDYLIENDVVVVTINYRLGPLGFLCLELPEAAGNMGLKDHVKALQWVQNNIEKFGGNKDNVTIFGVSAGSAACEYLMLSPQAKGIFHKCILQSGSCLNNWAINNPKKTRQLAVQLAEELGYTGSDDHLTAIFRHLFACSAEDLTKAAYDIAKKDTPHRIFFGFVPCIEQDFGNGEVFLKDTPYAMLKNGDFNQVPVVRGFCNNEGVVIKVLIPNAIKELIEKKNFTDYWGRALEDIDVVKYDAAFKTAYLDNRLEDTVEQSVVDFFGDLHFSAGVCIAGKLQSMKVPVYMYKFCYSGKLNAIKGLFGLWKEEGACHADDTGYILRHSAVSEQIPDDDDILMRSRMTKMWTNFAKTGNPTPDNCKDLPMKWPLFTEKTKTYLNIDREFTIKSNYAPEKLAILEPITHKYGKYVNVYLGGPVESDTSWYLHSKYACSGLNCCKIHDGVNTDEYELMD